MPAKYFIILQIQKLNQNLKCLIQVTNTGLGKKFKTKPPFKSSQLTRFHHVKC